jgi:hypothetical protein
VILECAKVGREIGLGLHRLGVELPATTPDACRYSPPVAPLRGNPFRGRAAVATPRAHTGRVGVQSA